MPSSSTSLPTADSFVLQLLQEQADFSAVEMFSAWHESASPEHLDALPQQARYYQSLLPATMPSAEEQYGFKVDLDACSGCKACVVACHTLNGLDEDESWRRVGAFTVNAPLPQLNYVTSACHHCADPGCLNGCPVVAYDKDPLTGIVRHLDDQCIGCKYCTMMCPYDVPQYSSRLGIVRKCDMCHQRLGVGEAPACVQSCPNEAISIQIVPRSKLFAQEDVLVPNAPSSSLTHPTTRYVGESVLSRSATSQDSEIDHPHESHWPLAIMLVMTQAAVGVLLLDRLRATWYWLASQPTDEVQPLVNSATALTLTLIGMGIAPLHLGQPLRAWRVFLGIRTSWLSREAVLLGQFVGLLLIAVSLMVFEYASPQFVHLLPGWLNPLLLGIALAFGIAGVLSSAMIYIVTRRAMWNHSKTMSRFLGSMAVLGFAFAATTEGNVVLAIGAAVVLAAKFAWEWSLYLARQRDADTTFEARSRQLIHGELSLWTNFRLALGGIGAVLCLVAAALFISAPSIGWVVMLCASLLILSGEIFERLLYFSSVVFDRMPGVLK